MGDGNRMYYTRRQIIELTKACKGGPVGSTTLDRWLKTLRSTHMVVKTGPDRNAVVLFHRDFLHFIKSRIDKLGPPGLPEPKRIAELHLLWRKYGNVARIADKLNENPVTVELQLTRLNLRSSDGEEDEER